MGTGSGTAVMPSDQLFKVLVPPPLTSSAKNSSHVPSAADPLKFAKLPAALYVPFNTDPLVSFWIEPLTAMPSCKVMFIPAPLAPNVFPLLTPGSFISWTRVPFGATRYAYKSPLWPPLIFKPTVSKPTVCSDGISLTVPPNVTPTGFPFGIAPTELPLSNVSV